MDHQAFQEAAVSTFFAGYGLRFFTIRGPRLALLCRATARLGLLRLHIGLSRWDSAGFHHLLIVFRIRTTMAHKHCMPLQQHGSKSELRFVSLPSAQELALQTSGVE